MLIKPARCLYLGATFYTVEDANSYMAPLEPPKNYKDEVKIKEWIQKAAHERANNAARIPILGRVKELIVCDARATALFSYQCKEKTSPLAKLADLVKQTPGTCLFGFGIDDILASLWFEEMRASGGDAVALNIFRPSCDIAYDPYRLVMRKYLDYVDLAGVLRAFMISDVSLDTAVGQAVAAFSLVKKTGFHAAFTDSKEHHG